MAAGWWASAWNREKNGYLFGVKKEKDVCPARRGGGAGMQARALLACKVAVICSRGARQNQHQDVTWLTRAGRAPASSCWLICADTGTQSVADDSNFEN